jgi:predicted nucleic acid-binding protein
VPHFLDTNVLLYAISPNPEEAAKRAQADALLRREDGALSVQVLQEFYVQATRASRPDYLSGARRPARPTVDTGWPGPRGNGSIRE